MTRFLVAGRPGKLDDLAAEVAVHTAARNITFNRVDPSHIDTTAASLPAESAHVQTATVRTCADAVSGGRPIVLGYRLTQQPLGVQSSPHGAGTFGTGPFLP